MHSIRGGRVGGALQQQRGRLRSPVRNASFNIAGRAISTQLTLRRTEHQLQRHGHGHALRGKHDPGVVPVRSLIARATAGISSSTAQSTPQPDFVLSVPGSDASVAVFGVEHTVRQPHIGEWVLQNRPAAVLVETACHPTHGAWPGNLFSCADQMVVGSDGGFFQRMFCQLAAALQEQGDAALAPGGVWQQACENLNGEQLAYVAALTTGAKLAFGDRPKEITYKRLFALPTLQQLDEAFAHEILRQYQEVLGEKPASPTAAGCIVDDIMMTEREAVMCKVAADMAAAAGAGGPVALVVGSAHLPGIHSLWTSGDWRRLLASDDLATSPLMSAPSLTAADAQLPGSGARRGMLDAVLSLSAPGEVLQDAELYLPAVPQDQEMERQYAFEFYSAQRVQMCTLPRELLDRVCSCWPGCEAGESMWEVLEPLRRVRPVNGGPGWDEEAVMGLRALDVYISAGPVDEEAMRDAANNAAA